MSHYRTVPIGLWTRPAMRRLSTAARLLLLYLRTGPHTTPIPGLSHVGAATLAEGLRWELDEAKTALAELEAVGILQFDGETRIVWMSDVIDDDWPSSSKNVLGWRDYWHDLPDCTLKDEAA